MKLWQKASALCAAVLVTVVAVCSAVLLLYAQRTILDRTEQQTMERQWALAASFETMTGYYLLSTDPEAVRDSLVRYCFAKFADAGSVLVHGEDTVFIQQEVDPAAWLPMEALTGGIRVLPVRKGETRLFIAGSLVDVGGEPYGVYTVQDVSDVYRAARTMTGVFVLISLAGAALGAALITLLMRRGARPLEDLAAAARRIAGGEYGCRAEVSGGDEIGALAADFNTMAAAVQDRVAELQDTARRQELFIGGVTHEFKTPLASMLLHAQLLRSANMGAEERDRSLTRIEDQCRWLEKLTQTLLKLLTLRQDIPVEAVSADALIEDVRASAEPLLTARGVALYTDSDGGTLTVNRDLMRSLAVNLADNAAKAYDPGDPDAAVWLTVRDGCIEVLDRGRGIPPEALGHIFEPFYMADKSRSKKQGGSGLGLALGKAIADAHGAKIEVTSAPGQGTTVRVLLKLQVHDNELIDSPPLPVGE